jgi:hypothetical protein
MELTQVEKNMKSAGATVPVQSIKACVVYDSESGEIYHQHKVLTLVGGREPGESEMAEHALHALRNRHNPPVGKFSVLHVAPDSLETRKKCRVDVNNQIVVVGE